MKTPVLHLTDPVLIGDRFISTKSFRGWGVPTIGDMVGDGLTSGMVKIRGGRFVAFSAIFLVQIIFAAPASGQDLILSTEENRSLGNFTLQIVDVDADTAKVWLEISDPGGPVLSQILSVNDTLSWKNLTLNVAGIYAGDISDLVYLKINSSD